MEIKFNFLFHFLSLWTIMNFFFQSVDYTNNFKFVLTNSKIILLYNNAPSTPLSQKVNPSPWRPLPTGLIVIIREVNHGGHFAQLRTNAVGGQVPRKLLQPPEIDPCLLSQFYHRTSHPIPPMGTPSTPQSMARKTDQIARQI